MESVRRFGAIVGADLLERIRSARFWVIQGLLCIASWWSFPTMEKDYMVLALNGHLRGEYSSAWIGMVVAMLAIWLSLIGFYLVRGTLVRDFETRVWQLLVATPLTRSSYLLAKWCSNMAVLSLVMAGALAVGVVAQLVRAENMHVNLVELVKPALLLALPSLALTSLLALVFDLVPWLRRTAGNVLFFILWVASLAATAPAIQSVNPAEGAPWLGDPRGMVAFQHSVARQVAPQLKDEQMKNGFCVVCGVKKDQRATFMWDEWRLDGTMVLGRMLWLLLAVGGVLLSSRWIDRAAASCEKTRTNSANGSGRRLRLLEVMMTPLQKTQLGTLVAAELQLTLRQRAGWWWLAVLAASGAGMIAPMPGAALAVVVSWGLLLDKYGQAALQERSTRTGAIVFSASGAGKRVLQARWIVLSALGVLVNLPAVLRFSVSEPVVAVAIVIVAASIPAWSLAFGALTGNSRTFELLACVFGYLALNEVAVLNVSVNPGWTAVVHGLMLPLALILAVWSWRRLSQG
ncbi:ABC transporter permease [Massilia sp. GCM10020059]|uniref:ABC transporter permease n=1 Tax=Massilia agrisoli TaxID=2892444 RepID=A0ABS8IM59_9BURK|nr:ABC transporter permease [Massilia agrisoli]MCC6069602.1 ABC transporter permease [Massilia agrisoli]